QYADMGYEPSRGSDGKLVTHQGTTMVEIPVELYRETERANLKLSDLMLGERIKSDAAQNTLVRDEKAKVSEVEAGALTSADASE
ncbi:MAG: hypothetical protein ACOYOU_18315, partial [Kiritimatiellia bacterium]